MKTAVKYIIAVTLMYACFALFSYALADDAECAMLADLIMSKSFTHLFVYGLAYGIASVAIFYAILTYATYRIVRYMSRKRG